MLNTKIISLLKVAAIGGNILFVLWILFNAMDEGFNGTLPEKLSAVGLIGLLAVNCYLLITSKPKHQFQNQK